MPIAGVDRKAGELNGRPPELLCRTAGIGEKDFKMVDLIYRAIYWVAGIHDQIMNINNSGGYYFDDKQLHFLVIGMLGMLMIFVTYPVFKLLAETGHTMVISWLYTFTLILGITFAIEIGQWFSGTGQMETEDIASGVAGFLVMFFIFAVIRAIFQAIVGLFRRDEKKEAEREELKEEAERSRKEKVYVRPDVPLQANKTTYPGGAKPRKREEKKKRNLADIAHLAQDGGLSIKNIAAGGKSFLEDLAGEIAEERVRTEEIPAPVEKIRRPDPEKRQENADRKTLILADVDGDDRMTFVMPSPEEPPAPETAAAEPEASPEVDELFAEFERAAAETEQDGGQAAPVLEKSQVQAGIPVPADFSEQKEQEQEKRSDISERPVYKD